MPTPLDAQVLDWAVRALRSTNRYVNGVWRDAPWRYHPWRAWVSKGSRQFSGGGSGLHRIVREIDVEMCFQITVPPHGTAESDLEPLGDIILAEAEAAFYALPLPFENAELEIAEDGGVLPVTKPDERTGASLARAIMVLRVTYDRGLGDPYRLEARRP